ncbi:MAG: hypothetical protein KJ726_05285, partial [Verrucomicrobia bacterium]|nr:hypothetical protein [Verrucomicrobiota bacterium]
SLWFGMTLSFWVGIRYALFGQLMKNPAVVLKASAWMYAVFASLFLAFARRGSGVETVAILLAGTLAFMSYLVFSVRRLWTVSLHARRLLLPLAVTLGMVYFKHWLTTPGRSLIALAVWMGVFTLSVFASRSLRGYEVQEIIAALRHPDRLHIASQTVEGQR